MTTLCTQLGLDEPIRFLKSTVLSFNSSLGLGSTSESTLNVELVDDCEDSQRAGNFAPISDPANFSVGAPVYFPDNDPNPMNFSFGGLLSSWTIQKSSGGKTYNARVSDPRQLLENTTIIIDSYLGAPQKTINYFNVYAYYEQNVLLGDCAFFGSSRSTERGMPVVKILEALNAMGVTICSPTGYVFRVNISSFPGWANSVYLARLLPDWYRIAGPGVSLLQILQDICDLLAYDFYVNLVKVGGENIIQIGVVDLSIQPQSFNNILNSYENVATDISYGQELRNEKTKSLIFGEQVHYLSPVDEFDFFFGEDLRNNVLVPVVPYKRDSCGFWILKNIDQLNLSLNDPLPPGPFQISELDIRSAMSSFELWSARTFDEDTPGSLNAAIRAKYPNLVRNFQDAINTLENIAGGLEQTANAAKGIVDQQQNPRRALALQNRPEIINEVKKIHAFVNNLGSTYYGKQFIAPLKEKICFIDNIDGENTPRLYSALPTNAGGWIEFNVPVLTLNDPDLGFFRSEDNRVTPFAAFATANNAVPIEQENYDDSSPSPGDFLSDASENPLPTN
jgi:hypothetical protein